MRQQEIIAHRLRNIRVMYGLSQKGAARLLGVTATMLMSWETGQRMPSEPYMWRIERLYQTLFASIYHERRLTQIAIVDENIRKYGAYGTGIRIREKPP